MEKTLPAIPVKRYFTIGEVSELCGVKPYVLRYWEQEFTQLKPMKRRGNRRYYQHHEVLLIRRIRELLYEQGFTISGARNRLAETGLGSRGAALPPSETDEAFGPFGAPGPQAAMQDDGTVPAPLAAAVPLPANSSAEPRPALSADALSLPPGELSLEDVRRELISIRVLLAER